MSLAVWRSVGKCLGYRRILRTVGLSYVARAARVTAHQPCDVAPILAVASVVRFAELQLLMIPADKRKLFNRWFAGHARSRVQAQFSSVRVFGLPAACVNARAGATLMVANHTAWWDPMLAIYLSNFVFYSDAYAMMDAKNLAALPFFKRVGAFGVDLDNPADGARALRYSAKLLTRKAIGNAQRMVWIFPQGAERPSTEPLEFRPGSAEIARLAKGCTVQPVAIRYEFVGEELPRIYLSFGAALQPPRDVAAGRITQQNAVARELGRIDDHLRGTRGADVFEILVQQKPRLLAPFFARVLGWWVK
jgi:Acyltransferase